MTLRRKIFIVFTLIWMAFIFSFSSRSGNVSICGSWIFDSWDFRRRKEILEMENGSSVADRCRICSDR